MTITRADGADRARHANADHDLAPPTARRDVPSAGRATGPGESGREDALARLPPSSAYLAFLTQVRSSAGAPANAASAASPITAEAARDRAVQAKLDGVRDAFSGPYQVDGSEVTARPMFRMNHPRGAKVEAMLHTLGAKAGVRAPHATMVGQGSPRDLVKLTQALIDAGHLPPPPGDVATRIRQMQWECGIGVDCAGYSKQAIAASAARAPELYAPGWESFRDLDTRRAGTFAKLPLESARPGDLITLDEIAPEIYGHNVVVYSHVTADEAQKATLAGKYGHAALSFLSSAGPHHVLEVDSSWGAGAAGNDYGGFRRDTWIFDASSKTWGYFDPHTTPGEFRTSARGPSGDAYHGTYRPR